MDLLFSGENLYGKEKRQAVECLLFVATEPLNIEKICELVNCEHNIGQTILDDLIDYYQDRGFQLLEIAGGYQFLTRCELNKYVEKLYKPRVNSLSKSALETLAIIAYCQPITRTEIENIRGVKSDGILSGLLGKGFVVDVGRKDTPGKPILYGTTDKFLEIMGINSLDELPNSQSLMAVSDDEDTIEDVDE